MLSTVNSVKEYTGFDTTIDLIKRAQAIVEIYIGKDEIDIENPSDLLVLDKMVAYQTVYMLDNEDLVYKQIAVLNQGNPSVSFDTKSFSPFIAPLTVLASRGLSFNKSKSYKTGRIFQWPGNNDWKQY